MTSRIKIVGVQFAANPDHEPETPMTAQENQRTIDLLTQLDRTRPRVTIKPEPTNAASLGHNRCPPVGLRDLSYIEHFFSLKTKMTQNDHDTK